MKTNTRKKTFIARTLLFLLIVTAPASTLVTVEAAPNYQKTQTFYMTNKNGVKSTASVYVGNLSKSQTIKKKNISINKAGKSVVKLISANYNKYTTSTEKVYFTGAANSKNSKNSYYYEIYLNLLKKGSATLAFKITNSSNGKTTSYKTTLTVKNYTNPLKTAKIAGIKSGSSTNLAGKLKKQNYSYLKLKADKKNVNLEFTANSGWKITDVEMTDYSTGALYGRYNSAGVSSVKVSVGTMKKSGRYTVHVSLTNQKDGGIMDCYYYINQK